MTFKNYGTESGIVSVCKFLFNHLLKTVSNRSSHHLRASLVCLFALLFSLLSACSNASIANQPPVNISIAGSTAFFPVLFDLTGAFSERHPNVVFDVRGGGSSFGESQLAQGKIDLATISYLIEPVENEVEPIQTGEPISQSVAGADGSQPTIGWSIENSVQVPIGLDGLAVIVNRDNQIDGVTLNDLRDIYGGRLLDWSQLGSEAGEIQLVIREDGSGIQDLFEGRVMRDKQISLTAVIMPTNADVLSYVALYPNAIGYVSRGYVLARDTVIGDGRSGSSAGSSSGGSPTVADANPPISDVADRNTVVVGQLLSHNAYLESLASERARVRAISIDGQMPTLTQILEQQYYLVYPLYLTTTDEPSGWISLFIDFILSPSGQEIVSRYHAPVR